MLDYADIFARAAHEVGPVNLTGAFFYAPNFFGRSGGRFYLEGGADWKTGVWDLTLGGRLGYQWIERNNVFGAPDDLWWSITVSRGFPVERLGTFVVTGGHSQTDISKGQCFPTVHGGQDVCGARVYGAIAFRF